MTIVEWVALAHIVGECLEQQSEFPVGCYPWVGFEMHFDRLAKELLR